MNTSTRISARDSLIEAAFVVFSRDPSAPLSVVAGAAGVGRATLHRYFSSRDALIRELAQIAIAEMDVAAEAACQKAESAEQVLHRTLQVLIPLGDRHGFLAHVPLEHDETIQAEFERQTRETVEMIEAAKTEGAFDRNVSTAWVVQAYNHLLYAAWESVRSDEATADQAAGLAWRTLMSGLRDES